MSIQYFKNEPPFEELQKIAGGFIRSVKTLDGREMWVNEDGLLKGLPVNPEASKLAGCLIVGNVAVVGEGK